MAYDGNPYAGSLLLDPEAQRKGRETALGALNYNGIGRQPSALGKPIHWQKNNPAELFPQANRNTALPPPGAAPQPEPQRTPIPTNFPAPPADATNQQPKRYDPEIAKQYGAGYMQSGGNTTVMDSNGGMLRLDRQGNQISSPGGSFSTFSSPPALDNPPSGNYVERMAREAFGRYGDRQSEELKVPDIARTYNDVKRKTSFLISEQDKLDAMVKAQFAGEMEAYKERMGFKGTQATADAHRYASDASRYGADQSARAQMYGHDQDLRGKMYGADQGLAAKMAEVQASGPLSMAQINSHNADANYKNAMATYLPEERKAAREQASQDRRMATAQKIAGNTPENFPAAYQAIEESEANYGNGMRYVPGVPSADSTKFGGFMGIGRPAIPEQPGKWIGKEQFNQQPSADIAKRYMDIYKDPTKARNAWLQGVALP